MNNLLIDPNNWSNQYDFFFFFHRKLINITNQINQYAN